MTSARTAPPRRPAPRRPPAKRSGTRRPTGTRPTGKRPPGRRGGAAALQTWWPAYVLAVVVVFALAWRADGSEAAESPPTTALCTVPATSVTLAADQWANARTIADVARQRGLPERAVVIALATAMQESTLHNLPYGDRDSLGLFQQRPSQGWGTPAQVQDPVYAAGKFYDGLVQVPGWDTGRLTDVAQTVQRSGFPEAYQKHETMAQELTVALTDNTLTCT